MHPLRSVAVALLLGSCATAAAQDTGVPVPSPAAPLVRAFPVPSGTRTLLFATGADSGFLKPRGCHAGAGGALYRPAFAALVKERLPAVGQLWVSTGGISTFGPDAATSEPESFYRLFRRVGYAAAGVTRSDLEFTGAVDLIRLRRAVGLPLLAANLRILETGAPALDESVVVDTAAGRIAIVGVVPHDRGLLWGDESTGTVLTEDARPILARLVPTLRAKADTVVLLAPLGFVDLLELLRAVPGIDLVLAHDGTLMPEVPSTDLGPPVQWLGADGLGLGAFALGESARLLEARVIRVDHDFPVDPMTGQRR